MSLGAAFCGVWVWAAENLKHVERARLKFDKLGGADGIQAKIATAAIGQDSSTSNACRYKDILAT
jgi:hypothetical protein